MEPSIIRGVVQCQIWNTPAVWYAVKERFPIATLKRSARHCSATKTTLCGPYCSYGCYVNEVVLSSLLCSFCCWDGKVQFESQRKAQGLPKHQLCSPRHDGCQSLSMKAATSGGVIVITTSAAATPRTSKR